MSVSIHDAAAPRSVCPMPAAAVPPFDSARQSLRALGRPLDESTLPLLHDKDGDDIVWGLGHARFLSGEEPHMASRDVARARRDALLRPVNGDVLRSYRSPAIRSELVEGDGWTLVSRRWSGGSATVAVTAATAEIAERVADEAMRDAEENVDDGLVRTPVWFWHLSKRGPTRERRQLETPSWDDITGCYPSRSRHALAALHAFTPVADVAHGRLILLHGPPGTGKTSALRSLARSWRDWCDLDVVLDPEQLFERPGYLLGVAMGERDDDAEESRRHRLLVLEDCDELIRADSTAGARRHLARLLNLTDGMLGQGLDVLVAITTNEPLQRLHPAVIRPGRCLAEVEVSRFDRTEAAARLGLAAEDVPVDGLTLAELLARTGTVTSPEGRASDAPTPGQYL